MIRGLTDRQEQVLKLMDAGYVAELVRPLHQRPSRRYMMRHPKSHDTDGEYVNGRTIDHLIDEGVAVKVHLPHNGKTWVFSRSRYEKMPMATGSYGSKTELSTQSPPSNTPIQAADPRETSQSETVT